MKISLEWMRDYVEIDLDPEDLAYRLTQAGLETEGIETVGDDVVIELETTSNRPDHLGHLGVAREIAWICEKPLRFPSCEFPVAADFDGRAFADAFSLHVADTERCPRYIARGAFDVKVGPSPEWLARRIEAIGLRPVNNVVDISNYVLFEYGQPLHAFDFDRLEEGEIHVRRATAKEKLRAINDREYELNTEDLVIADAARPVALAGVMGGIESEVGDATTRILLESAWFQPVPVRTSSRRLALASDSSYRFERRVDPQGVESASLRFCQLLHEVCGAQIAPNPIDQHDPTWIAGTRHTLSVRRKRVAQVLGVDLPTETLASHLDVLGFEEQSRTEADVTVKTPSFRVDVTREIDLVEEVARVHGFDQIPESTLSAFAAPVNARLESIESVKNWLVGAGYHEALTLSFVEAGQFQDIETLWCSNAPYTVRNPVRSPERYLRRSLLPNLLQALRGNRQAGVEEVRLFEVSRVYHRWGDGLPQESLHCAWVDLRQGYDYRDCRGVSDGLGELLRGDPMAWEPLASSLSCARPGMTACSKDGDRVQGMLAAVELDGVPGEVWCGEIAIDRLLENRETTLPFQDFSRLPSIRRDLNMVFDEATSWGDIEGALRGLALEDLALLEFVDIFRGKQVPAGKKSVTFSFVFRSSERTLTHEEVDERTAGAITHLSERFGASLRS